MEFSGTFLGRSEKLAKVLNKNSFYQLYASTTELHNRDITLTSDIMTLTQNNNSEKNRKKKLYHCYHCCDIQNIS